MNAADILGGIIDRVDVKPTECIDNGSCDVRDVTFYTIVTNKGYADVILHVDHNGYYGGWLTNPVECDEPPPFILPPESDES